jgi:hypothetical protein
LKRIIISGNFRKNPRTLTIYFPQCLLLWHYYYSIRSNATIRRMLIPNFNFNGESQHSMDDIIQEHLVKIGKV